MKNTVKKILALVFVVAMVCSLAVPAFATNEDTIEARVIVLAGGKNAPKTFDDDVSLKASKATVEAMLKKVEGVDFTFKNGQVSKIGDDTGAGALETGKWVVALNGKIVSEDLGTVAVAEDDVIVVYLYEATFETKLAQYDASNIEKGIISFYYYDAEGNKQPLTGATVYLSVPNLLSPYKTSYYQTAYVGETNAVNGMPTENYYINKYTTDEKGQVWVAPQHLAEEGRIRINNVFIDAVKALEDIKDTDYNADEFTYYNTNTWRNLEARAIIGESININDLYIEAGATGDMTVVYVLVAAAAVVTLGAVVVMKKKSVKAN